MLCYCILCFKLINECGTVDTPSDMFSGSEGGDSGEMGSGAGAPDASRERSGNRSLSLSLSLSLSHIHAHTHNTHISIYLTHTHTHISPSLSLSFSHTHISLSLFLTHTHLSVTLSARVVWVLVKGRRREKWMVVLRALFPMFRIFQTWTSEKWIGYELLHLPDSLMGSR